MTYSYYMVSYDLHKDRDYELIERGIKAVSTEATKPLESLYIIKSQYDVSDIRDTLKSYIDTDDSLLVIKVNINSWATRNINKASTTKMNLWS